MTRKRRAYNAIAVGFGNGPYAPAGYLVATIVLSLFALGYSAMAKHITATGAFYGFISFGLGRVAGMAAGALTTLAYVVFEASLVGIFSFFASSFAANYLGIEMSWMWFALLMLGGNALATYFKINLAATILGVFLISEILMLALMTITVLVSGGGPEAGRWIHSIRSTRSATWRARSLIRTMRGRRWRWPDPPESDCSSPSGPGSGSSRRQCTARSRATRRRSSRGRPCCPWSVSDSST